MDSGVSTGTVLVVGTSASRDSDSGGTTRIGVLARRTGAGATGGGDVSAGGAVATMFVGAGTSGNTNSSGT